MTDLSTRTPRQIDTDLAELSTARAEIRRRRKAHITTAHRIVGDTTTGPYGTGRWVMTEDQVLADLARRAQEGHVSRTNGSAPQVQGQITEADEEIAALEEQMAPLVAEFESRPWSRFFLASQKGGHIHSSTWCSTCNHRGRPTDFAWLPKLSGQTEAEAVAAHGAKLCTVCFPEAPVEWTNYWEVEEARKAAVSCSGSGSFDWIEGTTRFGYVSGNGGKCSHCGGRVAATASRKIRKHKAA